MNEAEQALQLLEDENLVWSSDFELIRADLVAIIAAFNVGDKRQVWLELRELCNRLTDAS